MNNLRDDLKDTMSWNQRMTAVGWATTIIGSGLLLLLIVGLFANWFSLKGIANKEQLGLSLAVNTSEVQESAAYVNDAISQTGESAAVLAETTVVDGRVLSVGAQGDDWLLNLQPNAGDDQAENPSAPLELMVTRQTTFEGKTAETVQTLPAETPVRVVYRANDAKELFALKVTELATAPTETENADAK